MPKKIIKISVVLIAKNEESNILSSLKSVDWADEILVFDNYSTDKTRKIAENFGSKVYSIGGENFADRKNTAFKKAAGEWILSLDADERVTPGLKAEILSIVKSSNNRTGVYGAYAIPRKNIILGTALKHGWWPDYVVRLFYKASLNGLVGELHEQPSFKGKLGYVKSPLIHVKHDNLSDMLEKTNEWSEIEARLMFDANHPKMNILRFTSAIFREFRQRFLKEKAFMDGTPGLIYGTYQVGSRFVSYAKLWEKQLFHLKST